MFIFRNLVRFFAGTAIMIQSGGCREKLPESAFQTCVKVENRYNAAGEALEKAQQQGVLSPDSEASLNKECNMLFEEVKTAYARFFAEYINTAFAQKIFSETRWVRRLSQTQLELVVKNVTDEQFKATESFQKAADRVKYMKLSSAGNQFINFASRDLDGNTVELSQLIGKGKYVLLDFWASWCPDCRREMPALVALFNEFKDKDFEIVGYSLDRSEEAWKKGVADLDATWLQLSDLDFWNSKGALFYSVQWIPTTILFSPDGKILERGLNITDLREKLKALL
jgi:thiol-disulfide isomerase/thioredoxin